MKPVVHCYSLLTWEVPTRPELYKFAAAKVKARTEGPIINPQNPNETIPARIASRIPVQLHPLERWGKKETLVSHGELQPKFLGVHFEFISVIIGVGNLQSVVVGEFFCQHGVPFCSVIAAATLGLEVVVD